MIAVVAIIVAIVVIALLVHGCEVSQSNSALNNYAASVDTLMTSSDATGQALFADLRSGELASSSGPQTLQRNLNTLLAKARNQVGQAKKLGAPGQLSGAQTALVEVMELRERAIGIIANNIEGAASSSSSVAALGQITRAAYMLGGSDVTYMTFVTPKLAQALNAAGITVGGTSGAQIYGGQILSDLGWLNTTTVGKWIGARLPASVLNPVVPGKSQGHMINFVTVGGTQLNPAATNTIAASPRPTFTLSFTNSGQTNEFDVECIVRVDTVSDEGTAIVSETLHGQSYTCKVRLPSVPPSSFYDVTAEIKPVPGETNKKNNSLVFPVRFN